MTSGTPNSTTTTFGTQQFANRCGKSVGTVREVQVNVLARTETFCPNRGGNHRAGSGPGLENLEPGSTSRKQRYNGNLGFGKLENRVFDRAGSFDSPLRLPAAGVAGNGAGILTDQAEFERGKARRQRG